MPNNKFYYHDVNKDGLTDIILVTAREDLEEDSELRKFKGQGMPYIICIFINRNGSFSIEDKIVYESPNSIGEFIPFNILSHSGGSQLIAINNGIARVFEINCDEQTRHLITGVQSSTGLIETNEYAAPKSGYTFPPLPDGYN